MRQIPLEGARRLAVLRQGLAGSRFPIDHEGILKLIRGLGCLQLDPTSVVARNPLLVLWSRLGSYDSAIIEDMLWRRKELFEYWAHAASIVLTEDFPLHNLLMRTYPGGDSKFADKVRWWMKENALLQRHILAQLRRRGPLRSRDFDDRSTVAWASTGWTGEQNVRRMLDFLWIKGHVFPCGRDGGVRLWDLAERVLPAWTPRKRLSEREIVRQAAQRSLRALGVARAEDVKSHFTSGRYPHFNDVLAELEKNGRVERAAVRTNGGKLRGSWFVHADDVAALEEIHDEWRPRTTVLSPFDNLIRSRTRTRLLFDFDFSLEIYKPKAQRVFGYFVMPVLHGDRLVGRIDPAVDRASGRLLIHAVHAEPGRDGLEAAAGLCEALQDLARFVGATRVDFDGPVPAGWKRALQA